VRAWLFGANMKRRWARWRSVCRQHDKRRCVQLQRELGLARNVDRFGQRAAAAVAEGGFHGLQAQVLGGEDEYGAESGAGMRRIIAAGVAIAIGGGSDAGDDDDTGVGAAHACTFCSLKVVVVDGHEASFTQFEPPPTVTVADGHDYAYARDGWRKWWPNSNDGVAGLGGGVGGSGGMVPTAWLRRGGNGGGGVDTCSTHVIVPVIDNTQARAVTRAATVTGGADGEGGAGDEDGGGDLGRVGGFDGGRIVGYLAATFVCHDPSVSGASEGGVEGVKAGAPVRRAYEMEHGLLRTSTAPDVPKATIGHLCNVAASLAPAVLLGETVDALANSADELAGQNALAWYVMGRPTLRHCQFPYYCIFPPIDADTVACTQ